MNSSRTVPHVRAARVTPSGVALRTSALFSFLLAASVAAQPAAPTCGEAFSSRLAAQLTPELEASAAERRFSGVVLVACNGKTAFAGAYGMAHRAQRVRNTMDTRFNLGSVNKMWTAIAIAQLVERKQVDLNAPVGRYLPDLPNRALRETVLVKHLLSHTSGLGSYFTRGYLEDRPALARAADLLRFFVDDALAFSPGARFEYSNAGFALLGVIVERVSGMNYFEYMKRNVLAPAGMTGAAFVTLPWREPAIAMGYATPPGTTDTLENVGLVERSSSPAGGAFATARDLVAFSRALWAGKLVGRALVDEFTSGKVSMGGMQYAYGFGVGNAERPASRPTSSRSPIRGSTSSCWPTSMRRPPTRPCNSWCRPSPARRGVA
ncbi:MAG: beta-lactamase family protein [Gemmatimonadaceae bacterium]|nr:beta-lactamase family protein [Gemmatimonadaceae bacterium]